MLGDYKFPPLRILPSDPFAVYNSMKNWKGVYLVYITVYLGGMGVKVVLVMKYVSVLLR